MKQTAKERMLAEIVRKQALNMELNYQERMVVQDLLWDLKLQAQKEVLQARVYELPGVKSAKLTVNGLGKGKLVVQIDFTTDIGSRPSEKDRKVNAFAANVAARAMANEPIYAETVPNPIVLSTKGKKGA